MTNDEIYVILDEISNAMQQILHKNLGTQIAFRNKLKQILSKLPKGLLIKDVKDERLKKKITQTWKRFFAKNQGYDKSSPTIGSIDVDSRRILIKHKFYLDCLLFEDKTILFKLLDVGNVSLIALTFRALHDLGILKQILYTKTTRENNPNIFEFIDAYCKETVNVQGEVKYNRVKVFARHLAENCAIYDIPYQPIAIAAPPTIITTSNTPAFDRMTAKCVAPQTYNTFNERQLCDEGFLEGLDDVLKTQHPMLIIEKRRNKRLKYSF